MPPTTRPAPPTPSPIQPNVFCRDDGDLSGTLVMMPAVRSTEGVAGATGAAGAGDAPCSSVRETAVDSPSTTSNVAVPGSQPSAVALTTWWPGFTARFTSSAARGRSVPSTVTALVAGLWTRMVTQ